MYYVSDSIVIPWEINCQILARICPSVWCLAFGLASATLVWTLQHVPDFGVHTSMRGGNARTGGQMVQRHTQKPWNSERKSPSGMVVHHGVTSFTGMDEIAQGMGAIYPVPRQMHGSQL